MLAFQQLEAGRIARRPIALVTALSGAAKMLTPPWALLLLTS